MKVLVACEFSGTVRDAFLRRGHDAWSCDILQSTSDKKNHIIDDVLNVINDDWDLMIAHPPCTYLSNSGVMWLHRDPDRWNKMKDGARFFKKILDCKIPKICVENPIMHKYAIEIIGRRQDQIIQPWQFGHGETKATCLWLKGLPKLQSTKIVEGREQRIWKMAPSKGRGLLRSIFYTGIAEAMAEQWG